MPVLCLCGKAAHFVINEILGIHSDMILLSMRH